MKVKVKVKMVERSERLRAGAGNRQSVFEKPRYAIRWQLHTNLHTSVLVLNARSVVSDVGFVRHPGEVRQKTRVER